MFGQVISAVGTQMQYLAEQQLYMSAELDRRRRAIRGRLWKCGPWRWST